MLATIVPVALCTCEHPRACDHDCHVQRTLNGSRIATRYPADLLGRTVDGCDDCTPGLGRAHLVGCYAGDPFEVPIGSPEYA